MTSAMSAAMVRLALRHWLTTMMPHALRRAIPWLSRHILRTVIRVWRFKDPETTASDAFVEKAYQTMRQISWTRTHLECLQDVLMEALGDPPNLDVQACLALVNDALTHKESTHEELLGKHAPMDVLGTSQQCRHDC